MGCHALLQRIFLTQRWSLLLLHWQADSVPLNHLGSPAAAAAAAAESLQSCPTLCDPIDGSPQGSPVPGILQARRVKRMPKFAWAEPLKRLRKPEAWVALERSALGVCRGPADRGEASSAELTVPQLSLLIHPQYQEYVHETSLVLQWLTICLPTYCIAQ